MAIIKVLAISPVMISNTSLGSKTTVSTPQPSPMNNVTFEETDINTAPSASTSSLIPSNFSAQPKDQGEGTSRASPDSHAIDSPDEGPLASIPIGKGKARATPPGSHSPAKKETCKYRIIVLDL
ncbi:hypothetical protein PGTUg99_037067 [Puccinia graminis f. sp. tritici]|uniref:Uncharacterized protein n=1 Tax=Puccinia graminis f. sp. tritici TaxID=56615 RepID=A0A5B0SGT1_PUCGR|nr:hypothetical protein PGTUg99_037067 [Puccinia graminis f. sp. tritici]